jgi:hypothetical protein
MRKPCAPGENARRARRPCRGHKDPKADPARGMAVRCGGRPRRSRRAPALRRGIYPPTPRLVPRRRRPGLGPNSFTDATRESGATLTLQAQAYPQGRHQAGPEPRGQGHPPAQPTKGPRPRPSPNPTQHMPVPGARARALGHQAADRHPEASSPRGDLPVRPQGTRAPRERENHRARGGGEERASPRRQETRGETANTMQGGKGDTGAEEY